MISHLKTAITLVCFVFLFTACHYPGLKGCVNSPWVNLNPSSFFHVLKGNGTQTFKTNIVYADNHFTGNLLVHKMDSLHQHLLFLNDMGLKLFDFQIEKNEISKGYVSPTIKDSGLVNAFKTSLKQLLLIEIYNKPVKVCSKDQQITIWKEKKPYRYFYKIGDQKQLVNQKVFRKNKMQTNIEYEFDSAHLTYTRIFCQHKAPKAMTIELKQLLLE